MHIRRFVPAASAIATAIVLSASLAAPASASPTPVGAVADITWGISRADVDRTVAAMRDAGVKTIRVNVSWKAIERDGKGIYNAGALADADYAVDKARAAGLEVLMPMADSVPYWASADPLKVSTAATGPQWNVYWRPRSFADYADFA